MQNEILNYIKTSRDSISGVTDIYWKFGKPGNSWDIHNALRVLQEQGLIKLGNYMPYGSKHIVRYTLV